MTDDELRALVRDAISRHLGGTSGTTGSVGRSPCDPAAPVIQAPGAPVGVPLWRSHPSFGKFLLPQGSDQDGPCLIEPKVQCNHCGFCQSHGH